MSSWHDDGEPATNRDATLHLRTAKEAAVRLPSPDRVFEYADLPPEVQRVFRRYREQRIIRHAETVKETRLYRTDRRAYELAQEYTDRATLPCGHGGFTNEGNGDYTCCEPTCDATHDRSDVEAYLDDQNRGGGR